MKKINKLSKTKISKRIEKKTNPETRKLVLYLNKQKNPLWHSIAKYLSYPKRKSIKVNINKINILTKPDEVIVIPGKILSKGNLNHHLTIAAFKFSKKAREKMTRKADILTIKELVDKTSEVKGIDFRIII